MASNPWEVEKFIRLVDGQAQTIVQIETQSLVEQCDTLRHFSWDYAYIGLNDLMVSRQAKWIWEPLADGTKE